MGKMGTSEFRPEIARLIGEFADFEELFVNGTTGVDTNDGLTEATALRTITAALNKVGNKRSKSGDPIVITISPRSYNEDIDFTNFHKIKLSSASSTANVVITSITGGIPFGARFWTGELLSFEGITFNMNPQQGSSNWIVYCSLIKNVSFDSKCLINGDASTRGNGIAVDGTGLSFSGTLKNLTFPIQSGGNSSVTVRDHKYTNCVHGGSVISGGIFNVFQDVDNTTPTLGVLTSEQYPGLSINSVNKGIVVESGKNVNGQYTKYADGTVILSASVEGNTTGSDTYSATVTLPVAIISGTPIPTMNSSYDGGTINSATTMTANLLAGGTTAYVAGKFQRAQAVGYKVNLSIVLYGRWK